MSRGPGDQPRQQAASRLQRIGRLADAERMLAPALENATTAFNIAASRCFAGRLAVERGDLDLAQNRLEEAWALMQRSGGFQLIGPATAARVLLDIRRGDLHRARERAAEGLERAAAAPGDLMYNAELYWLAARVEAELAEHARLISNDQTVRASKRAAIAAVDALGETISQVPGDGAPPESVAFQALATAELARGRSATPGPGAPRPSASGRSARPTRPPMRNCAPRRRSPLRARVRRRSRCCSNRRTPSPSRSARRRFWRRSSRWRDAQGYR